MDTYDRIEVLLTKHGMKQSDLAKAVGISTGLISQWKNRSQQPSAKKLQMVADYFGVSVDYLLGKESKEKPATNGGDEPLEDCIVLHRDGKTSRYKFTREQLDAMAEMIKKFGEEKTDL